MTLAVTILGSSGMYATTDRAASGYLLEAGGSTVWLDAGGGTWRNLIGIIDHASLDGVVLTHRHPDHVIDIFQAFHARHYGSPEPLAAIPLWAPGEVLDRLEGFASDIGVSFDMRTIRAGDDLVLGTARVDFVEMVHPVETVGVRVEHDGRVISYSADSGPAADFAALAGAADLFLCEATFQDVDRGWEGHMSARQAAEAASSVGAKRLVLTHLPPGRDERASLEQARARADGVQVELARDGLRIEMTP